MRPHMLIFGCGYSGTAIAHLAAAAGWQVTATERTRGAAAKGFALIPFAAAAAAIAAATHIVATAPPGEQGDPVLASYGAAMADAPGLTWIGYLSTTGVYGDRQGGWVDETSAPAPLSERSRRRLAAEQAWSVYADRRAVDLFRLAGIYGPGRSALDELRAGTARRIIAPDHAFGRIHRDDIAGAVLAATARDTPGIRVLNLSDDLPAPTADVVAEAASLLRLPLPVGRPYAEVAPGMSVMARSFWAENRRVASRITQSALGRPWRYPSYREGLRAILAAERAQQLGEH